MKVLIFLLIIAFAAHGFADNKDQKKNPDKKDLGDSYCIKKVMHTLMEEKGDQKFNKEKRQSRFKQTMNYVGQNLSFVVGFGEATFLPLIKSGGGIGAGIDSGGLIDQLKQLGDQHKQKNIDDLGWLIGIIKQSYNKDFDYDPSDNDDGDNDGVILFASTVRAAWRKGKPKKRDTDGTYEVLPFPHYEPDDPDDTESNENIADDIRQLDEISKAANGAAEDKDGKPVGGLCQLVVNKDVKDPNDKDACMAKSKWAYSEEHPCSHWEFIPIPDLMAKIIQMELDPNNTHKPPPQAPPNPPSAPSCIGDKCLRSI